MIEKLPFGSSIKKTIDSNLFLRRWKYSEAGLWLWRQFAKSQGMIIQKEDQYFRGLLRSLRTTTHPIFDVGANVGWVTKTFLDFSAKVVSVEPDEFCQFILINRFEKKPAFHLEPKAVSEREGVLEFLIQEEGSALNTFSEKWRHELEADFFYKPFLFTTQKKTVVTTTMDDLIAEYGLPCLAKIDVEGHELEVFKGLTQPIPLLVFEANLPVFLEETAQIIGMLEHLDHHLSYNYSLNFELMLPQYVTGEELLRTLKAAGKCSIDIICRMSNYEEYFQKD